MSKLIKKYQNPDGPIDFWSQFLSQDIDGTKYYHFTDPETGEEKWVNPGVYKKFPNGQIGYAYLDSQLQPVEGRYVAVKGDPNDKRIPRQQDVEAQHLIDRYRADKLAEARTGGLENFVTPWGIVGKTFNIGMGDVMENLPQSVQQKLALLRMGAPTYWIDRLSGLSDEQIMNGEGNLFGTDTGTALDLMSIPGIVGKTKAGLTRGVPYLVGRYGGDTMLGRAGRGYTVSKLMDNSLADLYGSDPTLAQRFLSNFRNYNIEGDETAGVLGMNRLDPQLIAMLSRRPTARGVARYPGDTSGIRLRRLFSELRQRGYNDAQIGEILRDAAGNSQIRINRINGAPVFLEGPAEQLQAFVDDLNSGLNTGLDPIDFNSIVVGRNNRPRTPIVSENGEVSIPVSPQEAQPAAYTPRQTRLHVDDDLLHEFPLEAGTQSINDRAYIEALRRNGINPTPEQIQEFIDNHGLREGYMNVPQHPDYDFPGYFGTSQNVVRAERELRSKLPERYRIPYRDINEQMISEGEQQLRPLPVAAEYQQSLRDFINNAIPEDRGTSVDLTDLYRSAGIDEAIIPDLINNGFGRRYLWFDRGDAIRHIEEVQNMLNQPNRTRLPSEVPYTLEEVRNMFDENGELKRDFRLNDIRSGTHGVENWHSYGESLTSATRKYLNALFGNREGGLGRSSTERINVTSENPSGSGIYIPNQSGHFSIDSARMLLSMLGEQLRSGRRIYRPENARVYHSRLNDLGMANRYKHQFTPEFSEIISRASSEERSRLIDRIQAADDGTLTLDGNEIGRITEKTPEEIIRKLNSYVKSFNRLSPDLQLHDFTYDPDIGVYYLPDNLEGSVIYKKGGKTKRLIKRPK